MIISNPRLAERGLSCCTTRFWVRLGLLVSYRTLAPLCRDVAAVASPSVWLVKRARGYVH